jgi:co-chaperonin GroES (HSP10)
VKVGDTVLFSWASGQEITVADGQETYLLMRESDLLAVLED